MASAQHQELVDRFDAFFRNYYREAIGSLARRYPDQQRSLHVDWGDLYRFDPDIADDYLAQPDQLREVAEEALRLHDLPVDVSLGQAHVRLEQLPEITEIRAIRSRDVNSLVSVRGIVRKATDVRPKVQEAAFECQRCGTLTYVPQSGGFQEPHECQGCERQGPFAINYDQSTFVDAQKLRVQESPEGLRGGETPQSIDVHIEDDITGRVSPGDRVTVTGALRIEQQKRGTEKSRVFDVYMEGHSLVIEDEAFESMDIAAADKRAIVELAREDDIYDRMVDSIAPSIFGFEEEKMAIILQLFSGVTKHLPDNTRIRGDLHILLIGDPGTGKCVAGDTLVTLGDGSEVEIRELVEAHLDDPIPVDDGVYQPVNFSIPSLGMDGSMKQKRATKVWKREAPDRMYRIRTASGRELEVTPSHPLYVQADGHLTGVKAEDLTEGQFIATPRSVPTDWDDALDVSQDTNTDVVPDIGSELRRLRTTLGLSQFECGLPRSTYQHYERGERNPSRDALQAVVTAFEERLDELDTCREATPTDWHEFRELRQTLGISQQAIADSIGIEQTSVSQYERGVVADGGAVVEAADAAQAHLDTACSVRGDLRRLRELAESDVRWDRIESIQTAEPRDDWVYDLEVTDTHNYLTNGIVSHNSQILQYIRHIAPRSVYTSGKGTSSAGLTAAAVKDDFGDGQQWTLEAGALVLADKGIAAIDELDKMRCVTGDTLVHLDGEIVPIRELALRAKQSGTIEELENGRTVRGLDVDVFTMCDDGRIVSRPVRALHEYEAPRELLEVTLESGERLRTTSDHPFFVLDEGKRRERPAAGLSPGDWVYVPRSVPNPATDGGVVAHTPASPTDVEPQLTPGYGAVLGYLAGDGNVMYDRSEGVYGIRFTNKEDELIEHFQAVCEEAFGKAAVRYPSERRENGVETVHLRGKLVVDRLLDAGTNLETFDSKRLPTGVTTASRATKAAFIRAFADSDGSVDVSSNNVKLFSTSYRLLNGVKQLLLEFGISSQLQRRTQEGKRTLHVLAITSNPSIEGYRRHIGFTLTRKQRALESVAEGVSGDRTIIDVLPDCGPLLKQVRARLRLYQSECGIDAATYCNFETGAANTSLLRAERILARFERRARRASVDAGELTTACRWSTLQELRQRYHVSQRELAERLPVSQPYISEHWGTSESLREQIRTLLFEVVTTVEETDLDPLRQLVRSDVKWRRVADVRRVQPTTPEDDRVPILEHRIAELLGLSTERDADEIARDLLQSKPEVDSWERLREELETYAISFQQIADEIGVAGSTVSRWFSGAVDVGNFENIREVCLDAIERKRRDLAELLAEIEDREQPRVYDLTVDGTHNYLANGMVVHNSEDRSALHEGLEQQQISISKAGINATLKSRCALLGAANPKYGRFDQYEPIAEQIDLEPALISRFDLIFTVTDHPDAERDRELADHILRTNYAGELNTQRTELSSPNVSEEDLARYAGEIAPAIEPELFRKYIAYAKRNCFPTMTDEAREAIRDFYVELRAHGSDEDAPVPVTARKLEALVRLAEASARVRLSDSVDREDAERVIDIVRACLRDIGVDPETGRFDADIIETGHSKTQRDRVKTLKALIAEIEDDYDEGAPLEVVVERAGEIGVDESKVEHEIETLKQRGEVYEPSTGHLRTT